jgi:periplasmic glucans biosynthesis protein
MAPHVVYRPLTRAMCFVAFAAAALTVQGARAFGFDDVAREAERLAKQPYRKPPEPDATLSKMSYDAYRKQRFRPDQSTWRGSGLPFELQYFPLGRGFSRALTLHEVVGNEVRPLRVPAAMFENGAPAGAAGFRVHRWIESPRRSDEVAAFLGASYFRMVAPAAGSTRW